jgi:hypothetical protein
MENFDQPIDSGMQQSGHAGKTRITENLLYYWNSTATWARFLAVIMFIFLGLLTLGILAVVVVGGAVMGAGGGIAMLFIGIIYLAILLFPALYLWRFSQKIKSAIQFNDNELLAGGFNNLMRFYRFIGILTIAIFGLYILIAIIGVSTLTFLGMNNGEF